MSQPRERKESTRRGNRKKPAPAHQNRYAFRHNKCSMFTRKIAAIPNVGLCTKCSEIVEWRKKYRKYKPLKHPADCTQCRTRTVLYAYHNLCKDCAKSRQCCPKCFTTEFNNGEADDAELPLDKALDELLDDPRVKERHKRALIRKWEREELTMDDINTVQSAVGLPLTDGNDDDDEDVEGDDDDLPEDEDDIDDNIKKGPSKKLASATTPAAPVMSKMARIAMQKDSLGKKPTASSTSASASSSASLAAVEQKMASLSITSKTPVRAAAVIAAKKTAASTADDDNDNDDEGDDDYQPDEGDEHDGDDAAAAEGDDEGDEKDDVDEEEAGVVAGDDDELSWIQQKVDTTPSTTNTSTVTSAPAAAAVAATTTPSAPAKTAAPLVLPVEAVPAGAVAVSAFVTLGTNSKKGEFTLGANKRKPQSVRRV